MLSSKVLCYVGLFIFVAGVQQSSAQILDQIFGNRGQAISTYGQEPGVRKNGEALNVNVPNRGFYDMFKRGSDLGINVLSGLVRIDRGQEAERSGLHPIGGRRPLSVRVFGIPVYERGARLNNGVNFERPEPEENDEPSLENEPLKAN